MLRRERAPEARGDSRRGAVQLAVRDPDDAPARRLQLGVALPVTLERAAGAVEAVAVELDDEPLPRPVEVDLVAVDPAVDDGRRDVVLLDEREEVAFKGRAGRRVRSSAPPAPPLRDGPAIVSGRLRGRWRGP
jgi:hypothetical protein